MKYNANVSEELKAKVLQIFNETEDKNEAVFEAMAMMVEAAHQDLVDEILADAKAGSRKGFRQLTENEKKFYEVLKGGSRKFRNSITAEQIDILPTETIDYTLKDVKTPSGIRKLITLAPPNVKKWLTASKTGAAVWGALTDEILGELTASISALPIEVSKMTAFCLIPKAIRDLEIGYVDRYFTAILNEALNDGFEIGYLYGDGDESPIGIKYQIASTEQDGSHTAKTKVETVTALSPTGLIDVLKTLSNNGLRSVSKLYLLCNPLDKFQYVNPAMFGENLAGGWVDKTFMPIEVIDSANVTAGDGFFTIDNAYTMGYSGFQVDEYKETKALDDVDVIIGKLYGNGRAADDNTAVYFDITKLKPWVPHVNANTYVVDNSGTGETDPENP
jgi:hypothetical protein